MTTSHDFIVPAFILGLSFGVLWTTVIWHLCDKQLQAAYRAYIDSLQEEIVIHKDISSKLLNERAKPEE